MKYKEPRHDLDCQKDNPECLCNTCKNDLFGCCIKRCHTREIKCPALHCDKYEAEEEDDV